MGWHVAKLLLLRVAATFDFMCQLSFPQHLSLTAVSGPFVNTASYSRLLRYIVIELDWGRLTRRQACLKYALNSP